MSYKRTIELPESCYSALIKITNRMLDSLVSSPTPCFISFGEYGFAPIEGIVGGDDEGSLELHAASKVSINLYGCVVAKVPYIESIESADLVIKDVPDPLTFGDTIKISAKEVEVDPTLQIYLTGAGRK